VLRDLNIQGCSGSAVALAADPSTPSGRYPDDKPVRLERVTLSSNPGAALRMGNGTAAALSYCSFERNTGANGSLVADAGTLLNISNTAFFGNRNGSAVSFRGVRLVARFCNFSGNAAANGSGLWAEFVPPPPELYATEGTGTVVPRAGEVRILGSRFERNAAAENGGALFVGSRMEAFIDSSLFEGNSAAEGGGAHAARDGCLRGITFSRFVGNRAARFGGGLLTRAPLCSGSNMTWSAVTVKNNIADGDGGGVYLSEAAYRWLNISGGSFEGNSARGVNPPGRSGDGGGLYLGAWSSRVWLRGARLVNNSAARSGGGLHAVMLSQDDEVDLTLDAVNATANEAGAPGSDASEGGAARLLGSFAAMAVNASTFERNAAGQGGAISFGADRGSLSVTGGTRFAANAAVVAGGALLAGEGSDVALRNVSFVDNSVARPGPEGSAAVRDMAVGGGFCCYRCNSTVVADCLFRGNHAGTYGGGAALLQAHGAAALEHTSFEANTAARAPAAVVRRRLQAAGSYSMHQAHPPTAACAGAGAECGNPNAGYKLGAWATTVDVANTTTDDGRYSGGGGLYLSVLGPVSMEGCRFSENHAESGGGALRGLRGLRAGGARTGCEVPSRAHFANAVVLGLSSRTSRPC
jgi:hypothetical protein